MTLRTQRPAALAAALLLLPLAAGCSTHTPGPGGARDVRPEVASDGRYVMGTVLEIELHATLRDRAELAQAVEEAFAHAARLDRLLSRFEPESDVSRLNARAGRAPISVDPRVRAVLESSRRATRSTRGAFDVTAGPVIALWTRAASRDRVPDVAERERAVARVGAERIRIAADGRVALSEAEMSIDLGGIAKGFALDRIARALRESRVFVGLLSFGQSSVQALGAPPGEDAWRLLLRAPGGGFAGVVALRDRAFSVSSSLDPSSEIEGVLYGHVVDPRTGLALTQRRQAAVVSRSAALAEVLSTALLVLDETEGRAVLAQHDAEAFVVDDHGESWQSPGWQRETRFESAPRRPESMPRRPESARERVSASRGTRGPRSRAAAESASGTPEAARRSSPAAD